MNVFTADLHIHTVLSPCGDLEMSPSNIIDKASEQGLDIIAVTDHNHTGNAWVTRELGNKKGIWVVLGAEISTREEVHCLVFLDTVGQMSDFQSELESSIFRMPHEPELFGHQLIVNEQEEILREIPYSLHGRLEWSIEETAERVRALGGLFVPAHVDRPMNGLYSQLGMFPPDLKPDAVEVLQLSAKKQLLAEHPDLRSHQLIQNSDAHAIGQIGRKTSRLHMKEPNFRELGQAIRGENGRKTGES